MTILEYLLYGVCKITIGIGLASLAVMAAYGLLKGFGYFRHLPPSKTSEQMDETT